MGSTKEVRGDVYYIVPDGYPFPELKSERGILFKVAARNVRFSDWEKERRKYSVFPDRLYDENPVTDEAGRLAFHVIVVDIQPGDPHPGDELIGVLIPHGLDKFRAAELLRRRYGPGTALLMSDEEWESRRAAGRI